MKEIQAELDHEVAENMMTVSVLPNLKLDESSHELQVGLENVGDNKFAQRFVITQGDTRIYESDPLHAGGADRDRASARGEGGHRSRRGSGP